MLQFRQACLLGVVPGVLCLLLALMMRAPAVWHPSAILTAILLAIGLGGHPSLRSFQFTAWIIAAVTGAMIFPNQFLHIGQIDLRNKWLILAVVQLVMFGMGTQMSLADLAGITKTPHGVLVGIVCHFSVMPLVGFGLAKLFRFPDEIAAGIILIGSCSSGLASNVMAYIARANLALSVTVTAVTTLLAPLMTPLWMKLLARHLVHVDFGQMMLEIIRIVLVPISAALIHDYLKHATLLGRRVVLALAIVGALWLIALPLGLWRFCSTRCSDAQMLAITLLGFALGAIVAGVVYHALTRLWPRLDRWMPIASMAGIVYFTTVTTAAGRDNLLKVGALLFVASVLHNGAGYLFGYFLSRASGLDKDSARSVAFEVGLQNGGMATGLASAAGKLATMGLAPAVFSPWMNVSGSLLANYWKRKPTFPNEKGIRTPLLS